MSHLTSIRKNKRGVLNLILGVVLALVFVAIVLPVGLGIWQATTNSFNQSGWSTTANTTLTNLTTGIGNGFNLATILPIVIAAGAVITILVAVFRMRGA